MSEDSGGREHKPRSTSTAGMAAATAASLFRGLHGGNGLKNHSHGTNLTTSPLRNKGIEALSSFSKGILKISQHHQYASSLGKTSTSTAPDNPCQDEQPVIGPDISMEDLMLVCTKLKRRVKVMETQACELKEANGRIEVERDEMIDFLYRDVLQREDVPPHGTQASLPALQREWAQQEEERHLTLQAMQQQHREYVLANKAAPASPLAIALPSIPKPQEEHEESSLATVREQKVDENELCRVQTELEGGKRALAQAEEELQALRRQVAEQNKMAAEERDAMRKLKLEVGKMQESHAKEVTRLGQQIRPQGEDGAPQAGTETPASQAGREGKTGTERERAEKTVSFPRDRAMDEADELKKELAASSLILQEKDSAIEALHRAMSQDQSKRLTLESSLRAAQAKVDSLTQEIASTSGLLRGAEQEKENLRQRDAEQRAELDTGCQQLAEKTGVLLRVRSDLERTEQSYALKTAQVAQLETGVQEMVLEMKRLRESVEEGEMARARLSREVESRQQACVKLEKALMETKEILRKEKEAWESGAQAQRDESRQQAASQQQTFEEELMLYQKESQKKSALAREIIADKDRQLGECVQKITALEEEIASGSYTDRKIMELATVQSQRDSRHRAELESCKVSLKKLQEALATKDLEVGRLTALQATLNQERLALRRAQQREGCNLEYLKNVVVDYLSFPPGALSEKVSLERVLATLLAFSPHDRKKIAEGREGGQGGGIGWLLTASRRPVKHIAPGAHAVSVSLVDSRNHDHGAVAAKNKAGVHVGGRGGPLGDKGNGQGKLPSPLRVGRAEVVGGGNSGSDGKEECGKRDGGTMTNPQSAAGAVARAGFEQGSGSLSGSGGGKSVEGSVGSLSLSQSDFQSLSGHADTGREGGRGRSSASFLGEPRYSTSSAGGLTTRSSGTESEDEGGERPKRGPVLSF
ncbi:hypothetical protein NSK_000023 [Nannochloropsis salina CCMP1776]|uniref:GRIP domain-containing protein n=1 Tax=Nannochloropsis salina CCMP1776 TaxID=1027361 RepID=A0A4D9DHY6_9STRA|nr:hypothetical protein NSK_000023 [Nannochloropsis salina CCMP1776]|eukprot:TFJ88449.1 hypothetical protein NSK_000023 [Nannochloropsis salina CCMP1776]